VALTKASGFRKYERLACLESGARAALAAVKEAVAEASGFAKRRAAACLPACIRTAQEGRARLVGERPFVFSRVRISHRSAAALGKAAIP
jgi:hypothetical protein